jgi:DNA (cytosine-5)-methyltransferase 1
MPIRVFDFFCGCGGTSAGFRKAGLAIEVGIDRDADAGKTFQRNFPEANFILADVTKLSVSELDPHVARAGRDPLLFACCAPCQPFSKQNGLRSIDDVRRPLLLQFLRFVRAFRPDLLFVENVPGLQRAAADGPFLSFMTALEELGYSVSCGRVDAVKFGVPQRRLRLVVVASALGPIALPSPTHGRGTRRRLRTVADAIGDLPPIAAGDHNSRIANHQAAHLSAVNLKRIRATPEGGGRLDWPSDLRLPCHTSGHDGHTDVYGRLRWDEPASCLTTRCISLSNGRFGHPTQDRALSVREAACLQTFPRSFRFEGAIGAAARQVGNAVPVELSAAFGRTFRAHVAEFR